MSLKGKLIEWVLRGVPYDPIRRKIFIIKGKQEVDKILKEDNEMEDKPWYQSKAKIASILLALLSIVTPISTAMGHPLVVPDWAKEVVLGVLGYGLRDAIGKQQSQ